MKIDGVVLEYPRRKVFLAIERQKNIQYYLLRLTLVLINATGYQSNDNRSPQEHGGHLAHSDEYDYNNCFKKYPTGVRSFADHQATVKTHVLLASRYNS